MYIWEQLLKLFIYVFVIKLYNEIENSYLDSASFVMQPV